MTYLTPTMISSYQKAESWPVRFQVRLPGADESVPTLPEGESGATFEYRWRGSNGAVGSTVQFGSKATT